MSRGDHRFVGWDAGAVGSLKCKPNPLKAGLRVCLAGAMSCLTSAGSHESRCVNAQTPPCVHAHVLRCPSLSSAPLAGRLPRPPSPGGLVSVITVLIFLRKARDAKSQSSDLGQLFFFPPKRITSKFCRTTISKSQGTQSKTRRQENPHFGRAELRTHFYPHALPAPGPTAKGARATFPSPGRCPSRRSWGQTGCESGLGFGAGPFSLV